MGIKMTRDQVLDGVADYVKAWRTAHNEFTRLSYDGATIVRFYATDIVWQSPAGTMALCTVGEYGANKTTRDHISAAAGRMGWGYVTLTRHKGQNLAAHEGAPPVKFLRSFTLRRDISGNVTLTSDLAPIQAIA